MITARYPDAEFMNVQFHFEVSGYNLEMRFLRLEVSVHNFHITNQFCSRRGVSKNPLVVRRAVEVTLNRKEENSQGFCPIYVQEFGLRKASWPISFADNSQP